jgi:dihydroorotate dehydrogenase (fumarate)
MAATSGIHQATDVLKMLMVGADVAMLCSVLLRHGIEQIRLIERGMRKWMVEHEYKSVQQMKGSMSQQNCADPAAFGRALYISTLQSYRPA